MISKIMFLPLTFFAVNAVVQFTVDPQSVRLGESDEGPLTSFTLTKVDETGKIEEKRYDYQSELCPDCEGSGYEDGKDCKKCANYKRCKTCHTISTFHKPTKMCQCWDNDWVPTGYLGITGQISQYGRYLGDYMYIASSMSYVKYEATGVAEPKKFNMKIYFQRHSVTTKDGEKKVQWTLWDQSKTPVLTSALQFASKISDDVDMPHPFQIEENVFNEHQRQDGLSFAHNYEMKALNEEDSYWMEHRFFKRMQHYGA